MAGPSSTQFAIAVHVLTFLAVNDVQVTSDLLAGSTNANPVHVRRVLGPLRAAGIVASRSGAQGGWVLARPADAIRLDDVWQAVCGRDPHIVRLHDPNPACPVGRGIQHVLEDIDADAAAAVRSTLQQRTVADLAADVRARAVRTA